MIVARRDTRSKFTQVWDGLLERISAELEQMQKDMYAKAKQERDDSIGKAYNWEQFMSELNQKKIVLTPWCEEEASEKEAKERSKEESKAAENEGEEILTGSAKTLCLPLE